MPSSDLDLKYIAHLARIALSPDEEQRFGAQLGHVLGYVDKLRPLDVSQVQPTAHAFPLINVMRPDRTQPSLPHDQAMRNAPSQAGGLFLVPKIVE
jgi:aspartyl-tRNA(Asn)/glutamyl-tRNA(Gln) amidotransferase subunit C